MQERDENEKWYPTAVVTTAVDNSTFQKGG